MAKKIKVGVIAIVAMILMFFDWRMTLGWFIGWACLLTLGFFREKFYAIILDEDQFTVGKYVRYIIFVFVILWLPLLLAFMIPNAINPYALATSYLIDRLILFMSGLFTKENKHGTE